MVNKMQGIYAREIANAIGIEGVFFLFAAELEFFVINTESLTLDCLVMQDFYDKLQDFAQHNNIVIENIDKEDGINQFEIQLQPNDLAEELADHVVKLKEQISKLLPTDFRAKPFADQPANGMHFHISMYDSSNEQNMFMKHDNGLYRDSLYYAVGGLLKNMPRDMSTFAPTLNCYERYIPSNTRYIQHPTGYNWGLNNRTCAIRIPTSMMLSPQNTRIEHRVCSSMADPHKCLSLILESVHMGIVDKIIPPDPIFGNAFDGQYDCLPISLPASQQSD